MDAQVLSGVNMLNKSQFLARIKEEMRMRGYSIQTEKNHLYWIKAFINYS